MLATYKAAPEPSILDDLAMSLDTRGHEQLASALFRLSAVFRSPVAEVQIGDELTAKGKPEAAWDYYFDAVYRYPSLGLHAGKETISHGSSRRDLELAATYLERAAILANQGEAYRLLGAIELHGYWVSCADFRKALKYFQAGAKLGDTPSQLVMGIAYATGYGVPSDRKRGYAYLVQAESGNVPASAALARRLTRSVQLVENLSFGWGSISHLLMQAILSGLDSGPQDQYDMGFMRYSLSPDLPAVCSDSKYLPGYLF